MKSFTTRLMAAAILLCLAVSSIAGPKTTVAESKDTELSQAELEQILAPIALYPDTVLSHVLIAATYPLEVVQAERWVKANRDLSGDSALKAVENKDWDPSVKALVAFPQIVARMSEDLEWTQALGEAFLADEAEVLASIQTLRERAYAAGNLESLEHVRVERETKTIVIEPAVKEVVYIPYYDTRVVYGDWHWHHHPPVYWSQSHYYTRHHPGSHFYWSSGTRVTPTFFFSSVHWDRRHVVVVNIGHHDSPYFLSSRQIIHHHDARRWQHDPFHHRGAGYSRPRIKHSIGHTFDRRTDGSMNRGTPDRPHWTTERNRTPSGRYPTHLRTGPRPESQPHHRPAPSTTIPRTTPPRRYGRHPGADTTSGTGGSNRAIPARDLQTPGGATQPRSHPRTGQKTSSTRSSETAPSAGSSRSRSQQHISPGGAANRLNRVGP